MKIFQQKSILAALLITPLVVTALYAPSVNAADISANVNTNASCTGTINGATGNTSMNVTAGNNVSLTATNLDNVAAQNVSGPGIAGGRQLEKNNKASTNTTQVFSLGVITNSITITFTPVPVDYTENVFVNNCPIGSNPVASTLTVNAVAAPASTPPATQKTTPTPVATTVPPPAETTVAPDTHKPVTKQASPSVASTNSDTIHKAKGASVSQKVIFGTAGVAIVGVIAAGLLGYLPFSKLWHSLRNLRFPH